ncbi:MAG: hypothetical protein IJZ51_00650 [Ruminiclostridium sp.]|nr:hypothetical protein [Ruminiclostridium sp.]
MKKVLSVILAVFTALSVTACSENTTSVTSDTSNKESVDNSGSVSENSSDESITIPNTPNNVDDKLPQCDPANIGDRIGSSGYNSIMKGTDGYYFSMGPWDEGVQNPDDTPILRYYDTATKKTIILCSKPQCMHDGNDFCAATSGEWRVWYNCLYNGFIYKVASEIVTENDMSYHVMKVLRADLQGNELSTLSELFVHHFSVDIENVVCHYGKMFINMTKAEDGGVRTKHIFIVDLTSGEVKEIAIPDVKKYNVIPYMTADGDYLYYAAEDVTWSEDQLKTKIDADTVMHRYNIKTGETEIISGLPKIYASFTVNGGIIYYTVADRKENTYSFYSFDTKTSETKTFIDNRKVDFIDAKYLSSYYKVSVYTDRKYLYVLMGGSNNQYNDEYPYNIDMYIYDLDGKELYKGLPGIDKERKEWWHYIFSAIDGEIYLYYAVTGNSEGLKNDEVTGLYMIKTEDLINGKTDWTKLYKTSDPFGGMN